MDLTQEARKFILLQHMLLELLDSEACSNLGVERQANLASFWIAGANDKRISVKSISRIIVSDGSHARTQKDTIKWANELVAHCWADQLTSYRRADGSSLSKAAREKPLSSDGLAAFAFSEVIGYDRSFAQFVIDGYYPRYLPAIRSYVLGNKEADKFVDKFGGLYYWYREEYNHELLRYFDRPGAPCEHLVTRGIASIRYPLPYVALSAKTTKKPDFINRAVNERIRCKLNMPLIPKTDVGGFDIAKYDGFVSPCIQGEGFWQWILEQRPRQFEDHPDVQFDTLVGYSSGPSTSTSQEIQWMAGSFFTQNQERSRFPAVGKVIMMRKMGWEIREFETREYPAVGTVKYRGLFDRYAKTPQIERETMRNEPSFIVFNADHPEGIQLTASGAMLPLEKKDKVALDLFRDEKSDITDITGLTGSGKKFPSKD